MRFRGKTARLAVTAGLTFSLALGGVAPAVEAFAATTGSVTISSTQNYTVKGDYKVYQLFTGSFDGTKMGDAKANAAYRDAVLTTLNEVLGTGNEVSIAGISEDRAAIAIADGIAGLSSTQAQTFANKLAGALKGAEATTTASAQDGTLSVTGLAMGYYLVVAGADAGAKTSAILVPVNGDVTPEVKASTPTVDKQVKVGEGDFDNGNDVGLVNATAWENITYKLDGTVASNIDDYASYTYKFQDTLPKGVTADAARIANWNVRVAATIDGTEKDITAAFSATTVAAASADTGSVVTWSCDNLAAALNDAGLTSNHADAKISLTYQPDYTTDEITNAMTGADGELPSVKNTVKLIYSNDPYSGGEGSNEPTPDTPSDLYTYQLKVSKVGEDGKALTGAGFTLKRGDTVIFDNQMVNEDGTLALAGLDSNVEYTLVESTVPAGMKSIDPIKFTIKATKDANGKVTEVKAEETSDASSAADFTDDSTADIVLPVTVKNVEGSDLPLTGQAGIIAGVAVGGVIIAVSLVAVAHNRKNEE